MDIDALVIGDKITEELIMNFELFGISFQPHRNGMDNQDGRELFRGSSPLNLIRLSTV